MGKRARLERMGSRALAAARADDEWVEERINRFSNSCGRRSNLVTWIFPRLPHSLVDAERRRGGGGR